MFQVKLIETYFTIFIQFSIIFRVSKYCSHNLIFHINNIQSIKVDFIIEKIFKKEQFEGEHFK